MKTKYKIEATAFRRGTDQIVDRSFSCFTHAVSEKQARSNVRHRHPKLTLRDVRTTVINPEPKKEVEAEWIQMSFG